MIERPDALVEVVSDAGEGAQKCGQAFAGIAARAGNGVWTVEIIPAEIQPPARSLAGASGNRIRIASRPLSNGGDEADLVVAFNDQVLLGRLRAGEIAAGGVVLLERQWSEHPDAAIRKAYAAVCDEVRGAGLRLYELPFEAECRRLVTDARRGKNMFVLGLLTALYSFELGLAQEQVGFLFGRKQDDALTARNLRLLEAGHAFAGRELDFRYRVPPAPRAAPQVVMNGNTALALGVLASGMDVCAMYPITPATSVSHLLADIFEKVGGVVHQAEDELAACAFAIGASYAGRCAVTITSGPGLSLKQEAIGLAVMGEIPLVVVDVQRGGPSTGQPTKVEQGDLLAACFGTHGDAPKIVLAPADVGDCFHAVVTARALAELFQTVVVVLSDAKLATAQQRFPRPRVRVEAVAPPPDLSPVEEGFAPYDADSETGLRRRAVPGAPGGMHTVTGLAHDRMSRVAYDPDVNQEGLRRRSRKLAAFQRTLRPPPLFGDASGELLIVGWGSTRGEIEEAVARVQATGERVSALHLRFVQPLPSGLGEIFRRFDAVMTVEMSYADGPDEEASDPETRRYGNLAWLLRARTLVDVDCHSEVRGQPIKPRCIEAAIRRKLAARRAVTGPEGAPS